MSAAVGATASITLLTAVPGSGKTLRLVQWMREALDRGEAVFVCNVNGLKLEGVIPFEDPREWQQLPPGSVLVVDEAQKWFRARAAGTKVPEYITAMETIRHAGIRLVLATQQPNYLDPHLRGLVGLHEHLKREAGKEAARIIRSDVVIDDPRNANPTRYDTETWHFPKECYALYQSAEVHTVKYVMPSKLKRWALIFAVCGVMLLGGFGLVAKRAFWSEAAAADTRTDATRPGGEPVPMLSADRREKPPLTTDEYLERMVPRIAEAPFSAPIFDERQALAEPELYCMASHSLDDESVVSCSCLTEQGTRYLLPSHRCVEIARHGSSYNPFRRPSVPSQPAALAPAAPPPPRALVGVESDPANVGSDRQGEVWGRRPETYRAGGR